jgi:hypothetical protein
MHLSPHNSVTPGNCGEYPIQTIRILFNLDQRKTKAAGRLLAVPLNRLEFPALALHRPADCRAELHSAATCEP